MIIFVALARWLLVLAAIFHFEAALAQTESPEQPQQAEPSSPATLSPLKPLAPQVPWAPFTPQPPKKPPAPPAPLVPLVPGAVRFVTIESPDTPLTYQARFERGVVMMDRDINQAIEIFQKLYDDTKAVRVQLELARSLYIAGRLVDAKAQFIEVLQQPIPITVRDKVEWYLSEIQKRDTFKIYIGLYQDTNPAQITSVRTFNIFGQILNYQPALPTDTQAGVNVTIEAEREIQPQSGLFASASVSTLTYPSTTMFNRQTFDTSIIKRWQDFNYKDVRVGNEFMFYNNTILYDSPYISTRMVFNQPNQNYFSVFAKEAILNFQDYAYLNGTQTQGILAYNYSVMRNLSVNVEAGGDRTTAAIQAYSSYGMYAAIGMQVAEDKTNLQLNLRGTVLRRNYWDIDPVWGEQRSDAGRIFTATLTKRDLYIFGLRPEIGYVYQSNNSNLPFYSYSKGVWGIYFKNVY